MLSKYEIPETVLKRGDPLPNPLTLIEHLPMIPMTDQTGEDCRCMDEFGIYRFSWDGSRALLGSAAMNVLSEPSRARLKNTPARTERGLWIPYANYEAFRFRFRRIIDLEADIRPMYDHPDQQLPLSIAKLEPATANTAVFSNYHKQESELQDNEKLAVIANQGTHAAQDDFLFCKGAAYSLVVPDSAPISEVILQFQDMFLHKMQPAAAEAFVAFLSASAAGNAGAIHIQQDFDDQPSLFS